MIVQIENEFVEWLDQDDHEIEGLDFDPLADPEEEFSLIRGDLC